MKKLMKYEFRKTWAQKLILLGITAVVEVAFLLALYTKNNDLTGISVGLLVLLAFGGVLMIGLSSVVILHRDMNTRQSYMLFMTPNSSYKILGAKVLENGLSILLTGGFFFLLGMLDITLLFAQSNTLEELWNMIVQLIRSINENIQVNAEGMLCLTFLLLTSWIATITTAYLADVVSAALLNGKRYNGLLSFALFILISVFLSWVQDKVSLGTNINGTLLVQGALALGFSGIMYGLTAQIMERKLSV